MSFKKPIFYFISLVYAVILLHNLTPHVHGSDNNHSLGLLSDWFQLLFGKEHHQSQDNRHLSTFSIQEEDEIRIGTEKELSDLLRLLSDNSNLLASEFLFQFEFEQILPARTITFKEICFVSERPGRAPPFFAESFM